MGADKSGRMPAIDEAAALREAVAADGVLPRYSPVTHMGMWRDGWIQSQQIRPLDGPDDWTSSRRFVVTESGRTALQRFYRALHAGGFLDEMAEMTVLRRWLEHHASLLTYRDETDPEEGPARHGA